MSSKSENDSKVEINSAKSDNPWVSCDSTSRPGLKFYVNKLTGIKVWNITDAEIAFAEKASKNSQEPVKCPTMDQKPDAKIYNKQIINNQFSNQLSNLLVNPVPFNVWDNPPNSAQQTYTLVPTVIAQAYQQLLPLANSLQNSSVPISYNAQQNQLNTRGMTRSARHRKNKWIKNNYRKDQNQTLKNQFSHTHNNSDLRNRIVRRRSFSASFSENEQGYIKKEPGSWNDKKHRNEQEWEEASIQMNLEPLKLLTASGSESTDHWYIVVDTDVILNNFTYLNNMAAADPDCHLLIPHHVMLELQSNAFESSNIQTRRIVRFLTEQIQSGLAMLGEKVAGEGPCNMAIMTCVKLATQNNNVILISNNPETLKYKSNTKYIHVFTIQDIKDILANKPIRLFRADSPTLALKITVPNDVVGRKSEQTDDFSETTFRRTFGSTGQSDARICKESVLVRFPEKLEPGLHQNPPKSVSQEELSYTVGTRNFMRAHSTDNSTAAFSGSPTNPMLEQIDFEHPDDMGTRNVWRTQSIENWNAACSRSPTDFNHFDDIDTRNVSRSRSVENVKIVYNQSPPKMVTQQEQINTHVGDRNMIPRPVEQYKMVCNQSAPKRITRQDHINTDVVDRNMIPQPVEQYKMVCSQSPPKRITHQEHINTDVVDRNMISRPVEQFKMVCSQSPPKRITHQEHINTDVVDRNMIPRPVEQYKMVCSQSAPKRITRHEHINTDVVDRNIIPQPVEQYNMVCSQSHPKRITHQEHINTDAVDRNMLAHSFNELKTMCGQSPPKQRNTMPHKELPNVGVTRTRSEENLVSYHNQSPSKSASGSSDFFGTFGRDKNAPEGYIAESSKVDQFQSPSKFINRGDYEYLKRKSVYQSPVKADDASLSSSSATSGHVSLDTINMKRIISMKSLTSTNKTQAKVTSGKNPIKSPEMMEQVINVAPVSRSSFGNDSDTIRDNKMVAPNIIVEESCTSGVISNSESSHSEKARIPRKLESKRDVKKVALRNVSEMFNVGCQSMEDVLRTRCDEWVFRFVQIMEEVLRVKLQEKLPLDDKQYPAPRDLEEAARSVIKKFSNNFSVVDAANKLSYILYKTSDEDGKIAVNIQPSDYMEMYSYGWFLVESFQEMSADCKEKDCKKEQVIKLKENQTDSCSCYEVKTAYESLQRLLYDIQNAKLETFVDHPRDLSADNIIPDLDQYDFEVDPTEETQEPENECHDQRSPIQQVNSEEQVANLYNLRSQKRKSQSFEDEEVPPKVPTSGKGFESTFFNCLQLQKIMTSPNKIKGHHSYVKNMNINRQNINKPEDEYYTTEHKTSEEPQQKRNFKNLQIHFSKDDFTNAKSQSKVVCNFTVNADIERKVKARQIESEYEDCANNKEENTDAIAAANDVNENSTEMNDESTKKFMSFMGRLARRLGDIFTQVKLLCDEYVKINDLTNVTTKRNLRNKMEMAYMLVGNIHESLDSISKRDLNVDENIQMLLKIANVEDYTPDDKLCSEYKYMINICKEKAEEFHNTIRSLLKMVRV